MLRKQKKKCYEIKKERKKIILNKINKFYACDLFFSFTLNNKKLKFSISLNTPSFNTFIYFKCKIWNDGEWKLSLVVVYLFKKEFHVSTGINFQRKLKKKTEQNILIPADSISLIHNENCLVNSWNYFLILLLLLFGLFYFDIFICRRRKFVVFFCLLWMKFRWDSMKCIRMEFLWFFWMKIRWCGLKLKYLSIVFLRIGRKVLQLVEWIRNSTEKAEKKKFNKTIKQETQWNKKF